MARFASGAALLAAATLWSAAAMADAPLKLGVLTDMSGVYSDLTGRTNRMSAAASPANGWTATAWTC